MQPCNCEHESHFKNDGYHHKYLALAVCTQRAEYVGLVCDICAGTCLRRYMK